MLAELQFGTDKSYIIDPDWPKVYACQVVNLQHPTLLRVFDVCVDDQDRWVLVRQAHPRKWRWLYDRSVTANRNELVTIASVLLSVSEALSYLHQAQFRGLNFSAWYESARTTESVDGELHFGMMPPTPTEAFKNSETSYMGSLAYSAPEALLCFTTPKDFVYRPPTPESDSYSLACLLFELLTGERLINAPDIEGAVRQVTSAAFPTLQKMRPDLPAEISDFVTRALSRSPEARPSLRDWSFIMEALGGRLLTTASFSEGPPQSNVDPQAATPKLVSVLEDEGLVQRIRIIAPIGTGAMVSEYLAEVSIDASDEERTVSTEPTLSASAENEAITKELQLPPVDSLMFLPPPPTQEFEPPAPVTGQLPADYATGPDTPLYLDENVQFTVYRPKAMVPQKWYSLLAFAHLSEKREDATEDEPDPVAEVRQQAQRILGEQAADYQNLMQDTLQAVPREGTITFVPTMPGIEFNPSSRSFTWEESVHREDFRLRAERSHDGRVLKGRLSVFLDKILLADIPLSIRVDSHQTPTQQRKALEETHARPYRKIFASYSHRDIEVVEQFERFVEALGDRYLRDVTYLRAGEAWSEKLEEMIVKADIFQLFWSSNSMNSPFVRQEWEYALSLRRPNFIRPTYWEEPLPARPDQKLPPEELMRLHFQRIHGGDYSRRAEWPTEEGMPMAAAPETTRSRPASGEGRYSNTIEFPPPPPASILEDSPAEIGSSGNYSDEYAAPIPASPLPPLSTLATTPRQDARDEFPLQLPRPPATPQFPLDDFPPPPAPIAAAPPPLPSMATAPPPAPMAAPPPPPAPVSGSFPPEVQYSSRSGGGVMSVVKATLKDRRTVEFVLTSDPPAGGMKKTYFSPDRSYVVQFFHDHSAGQDPQRLARLDLILGRYNPTLPEAKGGARGVTKTSAEYFKRLFCWPTGIVVQPDIGIVAPTYPPNYFFDKGPFKGLEKEGRWFTSTRLRGMLPEEERGTWINYFKLCILMTRAVRRLHSVGLAHSDLSCRNILIDPSNGQSIVINIDSLVVPNLFPPDVAGTPGYVAPEVLSTIQLDLRDPNRIFPSTRTDLHALPVLIYEYLLSRHPFKGPKVNSKLSPEEDEHLSMGAKALFVEDPNDSSNRPKDLKIPFSVLGPHLSELFLSAFAKGLHSPNDRPSAHEWERGLVKTWDLIHPCRNPSCSHKWFVLHDQAKVQCPFCETKARGPIPILRLRKEERPGQWLLDAQVVVYDGIYLFKWHVFDNVFSGEEADRTPQAYCQFYQGQWILVNQNLASLTSPSGNRVPPGQAVVLKQGAQIRLGLEPHGRVAEVHMVEVP